MSEILNLCATSNSEQLKNQSKIFFAIQDSTGLEKLILDCDPQSSKQTKGGQSEQTLTKLMEMESHGAKMEVLETFYPLGSKIHFLLQFVFIFFKVYFFKCEPF